MDIVGNAKKLERRIARSLDAAVGEFVGAAAPEPLEIIYQVVDRAEQEIQHTGRGRRAFPYHRIRLHVVIPAKDRQARARFDTVVQGPPSLRERIAGRLESAGVAKVSPAVDVAYVAKALASWSNPRFDVEFIREDQPAPVAVPRSVPTLKLSVLRGKASHRAYTFTGGRIDLGRRVEVLDARHRVVRTNHVAFAEDGDDANGSVSRRHAHIIYDPGGGDYRLLDDRSAHGTGIVRHGKTIAVHPGPRGVRLEDGDELMLGQAKLRVTIMDG